jgi:phenylacetate-CoA ligase
MSSLAGLVSAVPRTLSLMRSQYWERERLAAQAHGRLAETLAAARKIPFYAARLGEVRGPEDFLRLPVLKRAEVGELNRSVRALHPANTPLLADRSSGSTGMPVEVLFDAGHQRGRFAARARYLWENGWSPLARGAWIISLPSGTPDAALIHNRVAPGARFLSHGTDFREQLRWLEALDPLYLYTLPSNLEGLLDVMERQRPRLPRLRRLFCGAEVLDDAVRERGRRLLGLEIADNYGSTETFLAWQCPLRRFHVNSEHVVVEIVDAAGQPAAPGEMGRVLVTTLENRLMPLIRYEIGDWAVASDGRCVCGRTLPTMGRVVGRGINLFRLRDGRLLSPWHLVGPLKQRAFVRQFQIVQRSLDAYAVRYAAEAAIEPDVQTAIRDEFAKVLGQGIAVEFERLEEVPRAASGKFMTALSELVA